jgi:hypothetical protein
VFFFKSFEDHHDVLLILIAICGFTLTKVFVYEIGFFLLLSKKRLKCWLNPGLFCSICCAFQINLSYFLGSVGHVVVDWSCVEACRLSITRDVSKRLK